MPSLHEKILSEEYQVIGSQLNHIDHLVGAVKKAYPLGKIILIPANLVPEVEVPEELHISKEDFQKDYYVFYAKIP